MSETPWRVCPEHGEYKRFGDGGCQKCGRVGMLVDEDERIRAAAPDLLEALEWLLENDEFSEGFLDWMDRARAAKGREDVSRRFFPTSIYSGSRLVLSKRIPDGAKWRMIKAERSLREAERQYALKEKFAGYPVLEKVTC